MQILDSAHILQSVLLQKDLSASINSDLVTDCGWHVVPALCCQRSTSNLTGKPFYTLHTHSIFSPKLLLTMSSQRWQWEICTSKQIKPKVCTCSMIVFPVSMQPLLTAYPWGCWTVITLVIKSLRLNIMPNSFRKLANLGSPCYLVTVRCILAIGMLHLRPSHFWELCLNHREQVLVLLIDLSNFLVTNLGAEWSVSARSCWALNAVKLLLLLLFKQKANVLRQLNTKGLLMMWE